MEALMSFLGSEAFSNLIAGGAAAFQANATGDMLDFQKGLANKSEKRTETLFNQDQQDRDAMNDLDFA